MGDVAGGDPLLRSVGDAGVVRWVFDAMPLLVFALEANGAGTRDLTVDLTGVTHLASVGVAVLHRLAALSATNGGQLRLYAPSGTPADMIMTPVNLPHATTDPDTVDT